MPLYALFQVVPLPTDVVAVLSPLRVELHMAVASIAAGLAAWIPLSVYPGETARFALRLAAYCALFWIVRWLTIRLGRRAFAAAVPIVAVAVVQGAIAVSVAGPAGAAGSYINRNHLAGLLEMALPFAAVAAGSFGARAMAGRWDGLAAVGALLAAGAAVLLGAGLLSTRSRAGLVAALAGMFAMGLVAVARMRAGRRRRLAWTLSLPVVLGTVLVYLPSDNLVRRYGVLVAQQGVLREGRVGLWRETADLVAAYPIVGCGFGAYESSFLEYKRSAPMVNDNHAHNDYLELLAEAGVVGFILCIALAAGPVASALRASLAGGGGAKSALGLACVGSMAAIAAHSFVDFNLRIPANGMVLIWILGMSAGCGYSVGQVTVANGDGS